MGNCLFHPKTSSTGTFGPKRISVHGSIEEDLNSDLDEEITAKELDKVIKQMQKHNLERMKEELKSDPNTFILNNLLMCIQFFDNFERAREAAKEFKREKESEMTESLAVSTNDGTILGDRRCHMVHGMGHVLAKNYIYKPTDNDADEDLYSLYRGTDARNTFFCDSILPLEYSMSWHNLELYDESQWETLTTTQYSSAKGVPPIIRFCMEQPDEKNRIPLGYVRLRCVDLPISMRPQLSLVYVPDSEHGYMYDYSQYHDKAPDAVSELSDSEGSIPSTAGSEAEDEFTELVRNSAPMLPQEQYSSRNGHLPNGPKPTINFGKQLRNETLPMSSSDKLALRRGSGILPNNYPVTSKRLLNKLDIHEIHVPQVQVESSTPIIHSEPFNFQQGRRDSGMYPKHTLLPPSSMSGAGRKSKSMSKLPTSTNGLIHPVRESASSGYETGSQASIASRASSLASEEVRDRWKQVEMKQLWQYQPKNRQKALDPSATNEPLDPECFMNVKYEIESDDDAQSDSSDSDSESDTNKIPTEPEFETRTYLNSSKFSSEYCSEFHYIGEKHGVSQPSVNQAVVLGTTIRCSVTDKPESYDETDNFNMLHTYTPSLHSKTWPRKALLYFVRRMLDRKPAGGEQWPSPNQVEEIEHKGCNLIPLGYRSIEFFNTQQCLEWQVNFTEAETLLLNTFHNAQWRTYIFASLLFRAFLAPLGPQGLGIEHFRNIIYYMCNEDFVGWNDEQPGVHLKALLNKLYDCLGKGKMPSFFIHNRDLLKNIPPQNMRLFQGTLSKIRENLIVYCIYAFRNLTCNQQTNKYYPMAEFHRLYRLLTETDILAIQTPGLGMTNLQDEQDAAEREKERKRKAKKKIRTDLLSRNDEIEGEFRSTFVNKPGKQDREQAKMRKKRKAWELKQKRKEDEEMKSKITSVEDTLPATEKRRSIDLEELPNLKGKFYNIRLALIIEFFIKHFIRMARKSNEFRAYAQATMYTLQIENLCEILLDSKFSFGSANLDVEEFQKEAEDLRQVIGKEKQDYVTSRVSNWDLPPQSPYSYYRESTSGPFSSNWDFRKLPTPPGSRRESIEPDHRDNVKKFEIPKLGKTLQSLPVNNPSTSGTQSIIKTNKSPRRKESIKFMDKPVVFKSLPNIPRVIKEHRLDSAEDDDEATDL